MMEMIKTSPFSKKISLETPPSPVNISTPVKKKKKKDKEIVSPSIDVPSSHKKKGKKREYEDFKPLFDSDELTISHNKNNKKKKINKEIFSPSIDVPSNHKKKRKKKRDEEEEDFKPSSDSDELIDSHTKKRKKEGEVSISISGDELMVKKKKKENLMDNSEKEGSIARETEKRKNRNTNRLNKDEVVVATVSKHKDSSIDAAARNTKKKKKKKDETDVEGNSQEEETPKHKKSKQARSAMAAEHVNNEMDVTVSLETSISSSATKNDGIRKKSRKERAAAKPTKRGKSLSRNKTVSSMNELDLDLVGQLEEFVPDVRNKSAPEIMKLLRYDLHRFRDFKQKGVPLRSGRFTVPENHQIEQNMADFIALTNMGSAEQVLFPQRFKEQAPKIRKLKILHCFFEKIAEGIPRPCHQVYTRAKKIFDIRNHMGRFSEDELHSLQKLHQLHGNDWKAMSDKMDRSVYALQKRFVCLAPAHGPWSEDEESRLKQAIRDHLETVFQESLGSGLTMDQLCSNLPWQKISQKVETRHWNQCRLKWFNLLNKITKGKLPRGPEGYKAKILLINTLFSMSVDDLADIEWDEVACAVGNVTPMCVQRLFHRLKVTKVPNWSRMSYGDIIAFLKDHVAPALQKKLSSCSSTPDSQEPQEEVKYQLSQILSMDNDLEVDNT